MLRVILTVLVILNANSISLSQEFHYDPQKKEVYFEEKIIVKSTNRQQLSDKIWKWINEHISSNSLKYQDDESGTFVIKSSENFVKSLGDDYKVKVWYNMTISTADNLTIIRVSSIYFENMLYQDGDWLSLKIPAEKVLVSPNRRPERYMDFYRTETLRIIYSLSSVLKDSFNNTSTSSEVEFSGIKN